VCSQGHDLGDDADTVGAIVSQLAGSVYGVQGIPQFWVEQSVMKDWIIGYALGLVGQAASAA
jgi:ADP-ribosylglycohydrolase